MFSQSPKKDYIQDLLAGYPDRLNARQLAEICGWEDFKTVHQRKNRLPKDARGRVLDEAQGTLLPFLIQPAASCNYIFPNTAVVDWLKSGGPDRPGLKKRGRPAGSKSRRGISRAELEANHGRS